MKKQKKKVHKHKWQFKEEYSLPIEVIEPKVWKKLLFLNMPDSFCRPIIFSQRYATFICECGKEKDVKITWKN